MNSERKIRDDLSHLINRWLFLKVKVRMITYLHDFIKEPNIFDDHRYKIGKVYLKAACHFAPELLEEESTLLERSLKRRRSWQIKDRCEKNIPGKTVFMTVWETVMHYVHGAKAPCGRGKESREKGSEVLYVEERIGSVWGNEWKNEKGHYGKRTE